MYFLCKLIDYFFVFENVLKIIIIIIVYFKSSGPPF